MCLLHWYGWRSTDEYKCTPLLATLFLTSQKVFKRKKSGRNQSNNLQYTNSVVWTLKHLICSFPASHFLWQWFPNFDDVGTFKAGHPEWVLASLFSINYIIINKQYKTVFPSKISTYYLTFRLQCVCVCAWVFGLLMKFYFCFIFAVCTVDWSQWLEFNIKCWILIWDIVNYPPIVSKPLTAVRAPCAVSDFQCLNGVNIIIIINNKCCHETIYGVKVRYKLICRFIWDILDNLYHLGLKRVFLMNSERFRGE